jgi:hypothetical protein
MRTIYRDLYKKTVKGALPMDEKEEQLFELAMEEQREAEIDDAIRVLSQLPRKPPGRPRTTEGDVKLLGELMNKHKCDAKLVKKEFLNIVCEQYGITNKSGSQRYRTAFSAFNRNT